MLSSCTLIVVVIFSTLDEDAGPKLGKMKWRKEEIRSLSSRSNTGPQEFPISPAFLWRPAVFTGRKLSSVAGCDYPLEPRLQSNYNAVSYEGSSATANWADRGRQKVQCRIRQNSGDVLALLYIIYALKPNTRWVINSLWSIDVINYVAVPSK